MKIAKRSMACLALLSLLPHQATAQDTAATPAAPAAATSAGGSIESTLLSYQASAESASRIAQQIMTAVPSLGARGGRAVIATNADIGALVQLRIVLAQGRLLSERINGLTNAILNPKIVKCLSPVAAKPPVRRPAQPPISRSRAPYTASSVVGDLFTNASAIQTLVQTVATTAAVNETVAPAAGALNDSSLINLIASSLPQQSVFVPSTIPPSLITSELLEKTSIGMELTGLERARTTMWGAADYRLLTPQCQVASNKGIVTEIMAQVTAASSLVDSFESSLFSGQATSPAPAPSASASAGAASGSPSSAQTSAGTSFQQLVYADLMLRRMNPPAPPPEPPGLPDWRGGSMTAPKPVPTERPYKGNYYFVSVHSLESGGSTLTKTSFLGGKVYYSGGAVATFSIFGDDGTLICGGISYGYRGFIRARDISSAVADVPTPGASPAAAPNSLPMVRHFTTSCRAPVSQ